MFHRENEVLRQGTGIAVEGATVTVYVNGTDTAGDYSAATKAPIYPANVVAGAIANSTLTTDEFGHYAYYVPSGVYDEVLTYGSIVRVDSYIQMFDLAGFTSDAQMWAEAAEDSAEAAAASATSALASKNDAAASATAAGTSASDAATSATASGTARDASVTAELASEASANASETSRSAAAISETNAAGSATAAAASAASITGMLDTDVTLAANSDMKIATQKAVKAYVGTAVTGLLDYKGATDCSANPNYPAASKGDAYVVSVAGKIGGASGTSVDAGDVFFATADNAGGTQAGVGASWASIEHNGIFGGSVSFASAAEIRAGTNSTKAIAADQLSAASAPQTLTDAAPTAWDMSLGFNAKWTLGASRTLSTPTNPVAGQTYSLNVIQDGTGSRLVTWPASFDWGTTGAPTLTTTANKRDRITLFCTDAATPKFDAFLSGKGFS